MVRICCGRRQNIGEDLCGLCKAHAMLGFVGSSFLKIPLELHSLNLLAT